LKPIRLVLNFARRYARELFITVFSMLALVGVQLVIPWVIQQLIKSVTQGSGDPKTLQFITQLTLAVIAVYVVRVVFQYLRSYMAHVAGWGVVADLRKFVYDHLQRLTLRFYEDKQTGQLMSRVINDTELFESLIAHAVPDVLVNFLTLIAISAVLFSLNWQLALLTLIPIPLVLVSLRLYSRYVRPKFVERQRALGELNAILNDNLSGIREIKAFTREEEEYGRVGNGIDLYKNANLRALRLMAIFQPFIDFASSLGTLMVIYFGGRPTWWPSSSTLRCSISRYAISVAHGRQSKTRWPGLSAWPGYSIKNLSSKSMKMRSRCLENPPDIFVLTMFPSST
jgi:ATP-binding cassette subfamily B protein